MHLLHSFGGKLWLCQRLVVPDKLIHHSKTRVSNAQRSPWGKLMPSSRAAMNAPPQGLTTWANAPRLPEGHGNRWNWLTHYIHWSDWSKLNIAVARDIIIKALLGKKTWQVESVDRDCRRISHKICEKIALLKTSESVRESLFSRS